MLNAKPAEARSFLAGTVPGDQKGTPFSFYNFFVL
jgi:hypothetical protein